MLEGFQGCLDSVTINTNELPLHNKRSQHAEVVGLAEVKLGCVLYPDVCLQQPCQNGAACSSRPSGGESPAWPQTAANPAFLGRERVCVGYHDAASTQSLLHSNTTRAVVNISFRSAKRENNKKIFRF